MYLAHDEPESMTMIVDTMTITTIIVIMHVQ